MLGQTTTANEASATMDSSILSDENAATADAEPAAATTVPLKTNDEKVELEKPVSDKQVYLRYARAMGFRNAGIFLLLVIAFAVCLKMPGMLKPALPLLLSHWLTSNPWGRSLGAMVVRCY